VAETSGELAAHAAAQRAIRSISSPPHAWDGQWLSLVEATSHYRLMTRGNHWMLQLIDERI
jgi:hypothetical protein